MKLLVEFELDDSWEAYIPNDEEKLRCIVRPLLEGVKMRIVKEGEIKKVPEMKLETAERLAMETDYACFAVGEDINTADAGAFFLEGYEYAVKQSNEMHKSSGSASNAKALPNEIE